jgi:hypothetical protein
LDVVFAVERSADDVASDSPEAVHSDLDHGSSSSDA